MLCLCGHAPNRHAIECEEPGCPCLGFAPVAEGPTYFGIDVSESPDVSVTTLFNTETGQFARMTEPVTLGSIRAALDEVGPVSQEEADRWVGGIAKKVYDPFKDVTARQTNTIASLSKKVWTP